MHVADSLFFPHFGNPLFEQFFDSSDFNYASAMHLHIILVEIFFSSQDEIESVLPITAISSTEIWRMNQYGMDIHNFIDHFCICWLSVLSIYKVQKA